jgi:aminoglycoside phosphotransferase (APT) family kinase protein
MDFLPLVGLFSPCRAKKDLQKKEKYHPKLCYDCGCMNIRQLLTYINARHATAFDLTGKLPGGHQDGAYALVEPDGRRAVLKQLFAPRALPIMRRLHAIGYPTPDVLYDGTAYDGTTYLVQEFVPGTPMATLDEAYLEQFFALNDLQANFHPHPAANTLESWSGYVYEVVFARRSVWVTALSNHSQATAGLLAALRLATKRYAATVLPNTDVVHGDLHTGNMLVEHGQITGVIDMVYAGYGTRAIDLATMLHTSDSGDYAPAIRRRLRAHVIERFGPDVYAICMAYRAIVTVVWAIRQGRTDWIDFFIRAGWAVCDDLAQIEQA